MFSTVVTNPSGELVKLINYAPYGTQLVSEGNVEVKYGFTDKEQDATGLNYFKARYYDPELGRFISVDPACDGDNWFAYCYNNPVKYVDPTGKYGSYAHAFLSKMVGQSFNLTKNLVSIR